jgi:hypothetical protein
MTNLEDNQEVLGKVKNAAEALDIEAHNIYLETSDPLVAKLAEAVSVFAYRVALALTDLEGE